MRNRALDSIIPVLIAASAFLAAPATAVAAADTGVTETGTTTYEVVPSQQAIKVTIRLSIHNYKPSTVQSCGPFCTQTINYFWNTTQIAIEQQAKSLNISSNAGGVGQKTVNSDIYYRYLQLSYPNVYFGQTRVVTASYTIPAAPHTAGSFRAGKAYASLCTVGNGTDNGSVSVVMPDGYDVNLLAGQTMSLTGDANGKQTYSTGSIAQPYTFWSCLDGENADAFVSTTVTAGGQSFDIESWPEDLAWTAEIQKDVSADVAKEEDLTGFSMPGGIITIREAGNDELGDYAGFYDPSTSSATIAEDTSPDVVAHELSHIWFNQDLFNDRWLDEGFAVFSEQVAGAGKYRPCTNPGSYPGTGSPNLSDWKFLTVGSTKIDQAVVDYQYRASCYLLTQLAASIGPDRLREVFAAAESGAIAYVGAGSAEKSPQSGPPIAARQLLDLIDERGMVPAGVQDLNKAQNLLASYGILSDVNVLDARASARTSYHELATAAVWKMPLAVRNPMASWDFGTAETGLDTVRGILTMRDQVRKDVPGLSLDGTSVQEKFESAATQGDLDSLIALIKKEADAAAKLSQARSLNAQDRTFLQSLGLLGTDLMPALDKAAAELKAIDPDAATTDAGRVIDKLNAAGNQGVLRVFLAMGVLLALLLAMVIAILVVRNRRRPVVVIASGWGGTALLPQHVGEEWTAWGTALLPGPPPYPAAPASTAPSGHAGPPPYTGPPQYTTPPPAPAPWTQSVQWTPQAPWTPPVDPAPPETTDPAATTGPALTPTQPPDASAPQAPQSATTPPEPPDWAKRD